MVPKINNQGYSFKGIIAYLMHDKKSLDTSERVRWYETGNMFTDDSEKAAKVMAWTDLNSDHLKEQSGGSRAGRKAENGAVYHFSLAWNGKETPDAKHQHEYALSNLEKLNLQNHEYVLVAHNDTDHDHVHVVVNLTNPETGRRAELKYSKRKMQGLALDYEKEHGIYCEKRFENEQERENVRLTEQVTRAYQISDNGQSFKSAMEAEGLTLAAGRNNKRLVFIDQKGKIQAVSRFLKTDEGSPTKALKNRFADLDMNTLPEADRRAEEITAKNEQFSRTFDGVDRDFENAPKGQTPLAQKQQAANRKSFSAEEEKRRKEKNLKRYIERLQGQNVQSREKWNIDALSRARDDAKAAHERGEDHLTSAALEKAENALKEGKGQFRADFLGINKNRPKWAIKKELKEQGLSPVLTEKDIEYMRKAGARKSPDDAARREAQNKFFEKKRKNTEAWKKRKDDTRRAVISNTIDGIKRRTKDERQSLKIDELTQARDKAVLGAAAAVNDFGANKNFIGFVTGKRKKASAAANASAQKLEAVEKTLAERLDRFENHIREINKVREGWSFDNEPQGAIDPEWTIENELKKQGLHNQEFRRKWAREQRRKKEAEKREINQIVDAAYNGGYTGNKVVPPKVPVEQVLRKPVSLKKPEKPKTEFERAVGKKKLGFDFTGKASALGRIPPKKAVIEPDTPEPEAIKPIRARSAMAQAAERKRARAQEQAQSTTVTPAQLPQAKVPEVTKPIRVKSALAQAAERKQEKVIERTGISLEKVPAKGQEINNGLEL